MDRFFNDDSIKSPLIYREAMEFIGEVRAGISWERFCMSAVRYSDAFIDIMNDGEEVREFLASKSISREYARANAGSVLERLHFNRDNDYYLTLALPRHASEAQIHKRWKDLMLIYHPDRSNDEDSAKCAKRINEAYSILKNPAKKSEYDRNIARSTGIHFKERREKRHRPASQERVIIPPEKRRLVQKLIMPLCMAIACIVLLILFIENRYQMHGEDAAFTGKAGTGEKKGRPGMANESEDKISSQEEMTSAGRVHVNENFSEGVMDEMKLKQVSEKASGTARAQDGESKRSSGKKAIIGSGEKTSAPGSVTSPEKMQADNAATETIAKIPHTAIETVSSHGAPAEDSRGDWRAETRSRPQPVDVPVKQRDAADRYASVSKGPASKEEQDPFERDVFRFIGNYVQTYEEGDIDRFMNFFSMSAVENNSMNYGDIMRLYKRNFEKSRYRYFLRNLKLSRDKEVVIVSGEYTISSLKGDGNIKVVEADGTIKWILGKENGNLKIVRMDYERR